jgi:hypothetical protein
VQNENFVITNENLMAPIIAANLFVKVAEAEQQKADLSEYQGNIQKSIGDTRKGNIGVKYSRSRIRNIVRKVRICKGSR